MRPERENDLEGLQLLELLLGVALALNDDEAVMPPDGLTENAPLELTRDVISRLGADSMAYACDLLDMVCEAALANDEVPTVSGLPPAPEYLDDLILQAMSYDADVARASEPTINSADVVEETAASFPQIPSHPNLGEFLSASVFELRKTAFMWAYVHNIEIDVVRGVMRDAYVNSLTGLASDTDLSNYSPLLKEQLVLHLLRACTLAREHMSPGEQDRVSEGWRRKINDLALLTTIDKVLLGELRNLAPTERDVVLLEIDGFELQEIARILEAKTTDVTGWRAKAHARLRSRLGTRAGELIA